MAQSVRKDALIVFVLLAFVFAYFYQDGGWNENSRFSLIFATVEEGRFSIDNYRNAAGTATGDVALYKGHYYSDKAIGPAILGVIFYYPLHLIRQVDHKFTQEMSKEILTFLVIGLPTVIAGTLLYLLAYYISKSRLRAYLVTLAIVLGTMVFPFGVILFSHVFTASLLFIAFYLIFFMQESPARKPAGTLFLIGLLMGWALISEYPAAIIILGLVIYYFHVLHKRTDYPKVSAIVLPVLGALIPIALQLTYNRIIFGSNFSIGYQHLANQFYSSSMSQGLEGISWPKLSVLFGMTFHPTVGVFWESPVLLLSFVGAYHMIRQRTYRFEAIMLASIITVYFVVISGYFMWWGGYSLGVRHIIPVLPFFGVFLIFLPRKFNAAFVILAAFSVVQMTIAAASTVLVPDNYAAHVAKLKFFQYSNIWDYCWQQLQHGFFAQNLGHSMLHLRGFASLVPLLIVFAGLTAFFFSRSKPTGST